MKNLQHKVYILYENREKNCAAASEHIFCFSKCVAAPRCISLFLKNVRLLLKTFQYFLKNVRLLLKDINEQLLLKENVQLIFVLCVAASTNISMFFNERATASEKILATASEI